MQIYSTKYRGKLLLSSVFTLAFGITSLNGQEPKANGKLETNINETKESKKYTNQIKKISDTIYQLGGVTIDKKNHSITFTADAEVTNIKDIRAEIDSVEYVLVNTKGKVHEALFVTNIKPSNLNIAFKLLGYKENRSIFRIFNGNFPTAKYEVSSKEDIKKSYFDTNITWIDPVTKKSVTHHINDMLKTKGAKTTFREEKVKWSYGGSFIHRGQFVADINNNIIALLTDRGALSNYIGKNGEAGDTWLPISKNLPPKGNKVKITITPLAAKK